MADGGETGSELREIMYDLRSTMQIIQLQFDIMKKAVDNCGNIDGSPYIECIGAVNIAHNETLKFMELNIKLVKLINDLKDKVCYRK